MKKFSSFILAICMVATLCVMPIGVSAEDVDINMKEYDTNGDTDSNLLDILFLAQVVADWDVEYDKLACDVNEDESIDLIDVTYLARHFTGWSGY